MNQESFRSVLYNKDTGDDNNVPCISALYTHTNEVVWNKKQYIRVRAQVLSLFHVYMLQTHSTVVTVLFVKMDATVTQTRCLLNFHTSRSKS